MAKMIEEVQDKLLIAIANAASTGAGDDAYKAAQTFAILEDVKLRRAIRNRAAAIQSGTEAEAQHPGTV